MSGAGDRVMELRQLEYFVAVAEERSFTLGARRVHIVQSAASAAVARLELELGTALLERTPQGVTLTDAGRVVLLRARRMLVELASLHDDLAALQGGITGTIELGTLFTTGTLDLAQELATFRRDHPAVEVKLRVTSGAWTEHLRGVREGSLDLAVLPLGETPSDLDVRPVGSARLVLVGSSDGPRLQPGQVAPQQLDQLGDIPFIEFPEGWGNRQMSDRLFAGAGVARTIAVEVTSIDAAVAMVRGGLGLAFLPEHIPRGDPDLGVVALAEELPAMPVAVVTSSQHRQSAATQALVEQLVRADVDQLG